MFQLVGGYAPAVVSAQAENQRMALEPTASGESEILAAALHAYLSTTRFSFTGLTGKEATQRITRAVAEWAHASGWRVRCEAPMRYIYPPRLMSGGCVSYWSPSWSADLDLRVIRTEGPPIAVEIDRADDSTAIDKLRDEALRGRPALWICWHGALRAELPAGVARLHLPTRSSRSPVRYLLTQVTGTAAISLGEAVTPRPERTPYTGISSGLRTRNVLPPVPGTQAPSDACVDISKLFGRDDTSRECQGRCPAGSGRRPAPVGAEPPMPAAGWSDGTGRSWPLPSTRRCARRRRSCG